MVAVYLQPMGFVMPGWSVLALLLLLGVVLSLAVDPAVRRWLRRRFTRDGRALARRLERMRAA